MFNISKYYSNIRIEKISKLFDNNIEKIEDLLCEMIYDGFVKGTIDRLEMIFYVENDENIDKMKNW